MHAAIRRGAAKFSRGKERMDVLSCFVQTAQSVWTFVDPKAVNNPKLVSLNNSLFSPLAIYQHAWFKNFTIVPGIAPQQQILSLLLEKRAEVLAFFYNAGWFKSKHGDLRSYVDWCNNYHNADYSVSSLHKLEQFLRFKIDERRRKGSTDDNTPIEETCRELFHRLKAPLEHLAGWQGYTQCASNTDKFGPLGVLKAELDQARKNAAARPRDHHALCRATQKRFNNDEHSSIRQTLWSTAAANNDFIAMRQLLEHCLQNATGRRGEDARSIQLAMLYVELITQVKPAALHVIGGTIYDPKERRDPVETLLSWVRHREREECPIAALAVYIVYLNDIHGLRLLDIIRRDLQQLELLVQLVSETSSS